MYKNIYLDLEVEITIDIVNLFNFLACSTAAMLGILFLFKPPKSNLFLGLFLISLSVEILGPLSQPYIEDTDILLPQTTLFTLVFLLLYVKKTIHVSINTLDWMLFIPGLLFNAVIHSIDDIEAFPVLFFDYIYNIGILVYIFNILKKHEKTIVNFYSELEQKSLSWIKTILYVFLLFNILWIIEDIVGIFDEDWPEVFALFSTLLTFILVYWIGYKGLSQPELFNSMYFKTDTIVLNAINESSNIEEDVIETKQNNEDLEVFKTLESQIIHDKLYTDSELNLRKLAVALDVKEKELSRLINACSNTNFYHFINAFRVNEFKVLLESPKASRLSLLGLANEAGFSSKSTFYAAFKKVEGITPKQYENSLKK